MKKFLNRKRSNPLIKNILLFLILFGSVYQVSGQDAQMNSLLSRYWFYRYRLRNDFMVMGSGPGQSLVVDVRNPGGYSILRYGDEMILHGYYLTMLATEHRMLEAACRYEDLKNNEKELYYAIKAFERVDYVSETLYASSPNYNATSSTGYGNPGDATLGPSLNGYFERDDVPLDFISTDPTNPNSSNYTPNRAKLVGQDALDAFGHQVTISDKTNIIYGPLQYNISSYQSFWADLSHDYFPGNVQTPHLPILDYQQGKDHKANGDYDKNHGIFGLSEESQDQAIRLLIGFKTIASSITDQLYQIDLDGDGISETSMNFHREAKRHTTNIIGRMAGILKGTLMNLNLNQEFLWHQPLVGAVQINLPFIPTGYWTIQNPRLQRTYGGALVGFTKPLMMLASTMYTEYNDLGITDPNYADVYSNLDPFLVNYWNNGNCPTGIQNGKMTFYCNILSNSGTGGQAMEDYLYEKTGSQSWERYYIPLYDYLYGIPNNGVNDPSGKRASSFTSAKNTLLQAPCIGPYNFGKNSQYRTVQMESDGVPPLWCTDYMFDQSRERSLNGYTTSVKHDWDIDWDWEDLGLEDNQTTSITYNEGYFPGIDFMLMYNLYYAGSVETKPMYHDLINRLIDYPINTSNNGDLSFSSTDQSMIGAFETMKVTNTLTTANSSIEVKAGQQIRLLPGTDITATGTGNFDLHIGKLKCSETLYNDPNSQTGNRMATCATCDLENGVGEHFAPMVSKSVSAYKTEDPAKVQFGMKNKLIDKNNSTYIFPNPSNKEINISSTLSYDKIRIVDLSGKVLLEQSSTLSNIDVESLLAGLYMIQLISQDKVVHVEKISKY